MPTPHGEFVWYELMTTDTEAARRFYGAVLDWTATDVPGSEMHYALFNAGEMAAGGVMAQMEDARQAGIPPAWLGYVGVDDVDAAAARVVELGGTVHHGPTDIPGVCRFAVIADPGSAVLGVMHWVTPGPGDAPRPALMTKGHAGWHELMAADWPRAFDFYSGLFGWMKADAIDLGPMGTYQLFASDGRGIGGMFNKPPMVPMPFWQYYFTVGAIVDAASRVTEAGGRVTNGPMEVPGGAWIINCVDPQGAVFSLVGEGPQKAD